MSEQKRYTAQEMREAADECYVVNPKTFSYTKVYRMLRQAADAEEELARIKNDVKCNKNCPACSVTDECIRLQRENAQLKARLEAVVKECEKMRDDFSKRMYSFTGIGATNMKNIYKDKIEVVDAILRAARGEGGAE